MKNTLFATALFCSVGTTVTSAPIDVFFQGTLVFNPSGSRFVENSVPEVDTAILDLLGGAPISGRFTINLDTPLKAGTSTAPGAVAEYENASTDIEISVNGSNFEVDDPSTCNGPEPSVFCDARQTNDVPIGTRQLDNYSVFSDVVTSDDLTREIEASSGVSATVVEPTFSFFAPVFADVSFFAAGFDLFPTTALGSPFDIPVELRRMVFSLRTPDSFILDDRIGRPFYQFEIRDLQTSEVRIPTAPVPLPAPALLLLTGFAGLFLFRRRG